MTAPAPRAPEREAGRKIPTEELRRMARRKADAVQMVLDGGSILDSELWWVPKVGRHLCAEGSRVMRFNNFDDALNAAKKAQQSMRDEIAKRKASKETP